MRTSWNTRSRESSLKKHIQPLSERSLRRAARVLAARDHDLGRIHAEFGPPPLWARAEGFSTLIHIILEQQVSLASALAAHTRLIAATNPLTPERFLQLDDATLRAIGFSRQKTLYGRELALALVQGQLDLDSLQSATDEEVHITLSQIKGIGRWTTDIYLLMALRRPDIWPRGDLALAVAVQQVMRLRQRPTDQELAEMSESWKPYRAVAARMFWHYYLSTRNKT